MRKLRKRVSRSTRSADARSTSTRASIVVSTTAMPSPATAPIHEHLPPQVRKDRKEVGWTKGLELAKLARRDDQHFDCATWLHKARKLPKEDFRREVERELTGKETEPSELICFKVYKRLGSSYSWGRSHTATMAPQVQLLAVDVLVAAPSQRCQEIRRA
jgi:hypothetical protein